ncbi:hypothetical protein [Paenibacillus glucanolyticus]|uniref:hypothetical protein n=1 Tax=Paenibacillus glucanolyticus TaxID=59843 RepID=UPI000970184D|nr:hypothetical protein [Paenibacillus glucanolyticus]OMF76731.1 hypothetical protein BK142_14520 [Paenibacillus glucanolyticus]
MGFTKGTWTVFKPLIEALHENSKFHLVDHGEFIIISELCGNDAYVHRIHPETGDIETLNKRCGWNWEDNLWLQAPIKIIPVWSLHTYEKGYYSVYDDYEAAIEQSRSTGHMVVQGFATDHPLPNVGKFYLQKDDLIEDILTEESMTNDLIIDKTMEVI